MCTRCGSYSASVCPQSHVELTSLVAPFSLRFPQNAAHVSRFDGHHENTSKSGWALGGLVSVRYSPGSAQRRALPQGKTLCAQTMPFVVRPRRRAGRPVLYLPKICGVARMHSSKLLPCTGKPHRFVYHVGTSVINMRESAEGCFSAVTVVDTCGLLSFSIAVFMVSVQDRQSGSKDKGRGAGKNDMLFLPPLLARFQALLKVRNAINARVSCHHPPTPHLDSAARYPRQRRAKQRTSSLAWRSARSRGCTTPSRAPTGGGA